MLQNELIRVIKHRYVWGVLILCIILNCLYLLHVDTDSYTSDKYRKFWKELDNTDLLEAINVVEEEYKKNEFDEIVYSRIINELEMLDSYENYRNEIYESAKKISIISKVVGEGFTEKNNQKTYKHFQNMKPVTVTPGPSLGIEKLFGITTSAFVFIILVVIGYILFIEENESGIRQLTYVTAYGKTRLFTAKYVAHIICMVISVVMMYACNYVILANMYGMGDINRSIQSVLEYRSCGYILSVWEFVLYGIMLLCFLYAVIIALIDCVCVYAGGIVTGLLILLLCLGICLLLYIRIPLNSAYSLVKYLNPVFCLDIGQIIGKYVNLNVFGNPVTYVVAVIIFYILIAIVCIVSAILRFSNIEKNHEHTIQRTVFGRNGGCHVSMFRHEMYKIVKGAHMPALLCIFLIISIVISHKDRLVFDDENEYYYYSYMKKLEGTITGEKRDYIRKENEKYNGLNMELEQYILEGNENGALAVNEKLRPYAALQRVTMLDNYLNTNRLDSYVYGDGYRKLTAISGNTDNLMLMLLGMVILIFMLSGVFALDYETGQYTLYGSTCRGRRIGTRYRLLCSLIICLITYLIVYVPQIIVYARLYGYKYIGKSTACLNMQELGGLDIPIWLWLAGCYICRFLAMIVFGLVVLYLSRKLKNRFVSICISGIIIMVIMCFCVF